MDALVWRAVNDSTLAFHDGHAVVVVSHDGDLVVVKCQVDGSKFEAYAEELTEGEGS